MAEKKPADAESDKPSSGFWILLLIVILFGVGISFYKPDPPTPPICVGAQQIRLGVGDRLVGTALSMECTTNWIRIPYGSWANIDTGMGPREEIHFEFPNGSTRHITPKSRPKGTDIPFREFRIWGKGVPTYTITSRD